MMEDQRSTALGVTWTGIQGLTSVENGLTRMTRKAIDNQGHKGATMHYFIFGYNY